MNDDYYRKLCSAILAQAGKDIIAGDCDAALWLVNSGRFLAKDCKLRLDCVGFVDKYFSVVECGSILFINKRKVSEDKYD